MADSSKISFLLFVFTFLISRQIYARESQFFNKIPSNNNNNNNVATAGENQPNHEDPLNKAAADQEPTFIPENENGGYGLYGHESGQLPPTTTTTTTNNPTATNNDPSGFLPKYLPKNYNTVAYVTQPEGYTQPKATSNNNHYNAGNAYYRDQSQDYSASAAAANGVDHRSYYPTNYNANRYNSEQQQSVNQFKLDQKGNYNYNTNADNSNYYNSNVEKQGMSDTRFMENGRYFYDINLEENNNRYPFENPTTFGDQYSNKINGGYNSRTFGDQDSNKINGGYNSRIFGDQDSNKINGGYKSYNYGSNNENSYGFNGFESQGEQFQDFQNQRALP